MGDHQNYIGIGLHLFDVNLDVHFHVEPYCI